MKPALAALGSITILGHIFFAQKYFWLTSALTALFFSYMFGNTLRGGVDMASASMRYLYTKASRLGLSSFTDEELNEDEKRKNISRFRGTYVGGLYNEGNTCFINSVVQSLASCDAINAFAVTISQHASSSFSEELAKLVHDLNRIRTAYHTYSTARLIQSLGGSSRWARLDQEDAQEFFQELLTALEKNLQAHHKHLGLAQEDKEKKPQIVTPFDGYSAIRVGCLSCGDMEGIRTGVVSSVDVSLDLDHSAFTIDQLLASYCHMETIPEVECYRCSLVNFKAKLEEKIEAAGPQSPLGTALTLRVAEVDTALRKKVIDEKEYKTLKPNTHKVLGDKTKQTMFATPLPDVLMIHISRSVFDLRAGYARKNYAPVQFPAVLDMSKYVADPEAEGNQNPANPMEGTPQNPEWYQLKATVIHYGSANFGHYVSFRKFNGFWWRISDDSVDLTTEAQVLGAQGVFMLFYEKTTAQSTKEVDIEVVSDTEEGPLEDPETVASDQDLESSDAHL